MVILCKGADFSTSGLGVLNYQPSAEAILFSSYLSRNITNDQILGLDTFINTLKSKSVWDSITQLYIPMVSFVNNDSTALLDSFIDVKKTWDNGSVLKNTYATNAKLQSNYKFANKGIERLTVPLNYADTSVMFRLQESTTLTSKNSHILMYKLGGTYAFSDTNKNDYFGYAYSATLKTPEFRQVGSSSARIGTAIASSDNSVNLSNSASNIVIGYSSKDGIINKKGNSYSSFNNSASAEFNLDNPLYFAPLQLGISIGLVSIGTGMTLTQMQDFETAVNDLATFF